MTSRADRPEDLPRKPLLEHLEDLRRTIIGMVIALVIGMAVAAPFAPVVMRWESLFRYAQDIWAPMAAPVVVVFLAGALWKSAGRRGANVCLWLAILTVPFTLAKSVLADMGIPFLPPALANLENPLVLAGAVGLVAWALMGTLRDSRPLAVALAAALPLCALIVAVAIASPVAIALLLGAVMALAIGVPGVRRVTAVAGMWDRSMLLTEPKRPWYAGLWLWWAVFAVILAFLYFYFW